MNDLIQQANDLKNLSDQQLQMVQRDQSVPPYLVVSEMKRRDDMRKAYQAMQQQPRPPTVAQQVVGQFQQGLRPQGGGPPPMAGQQQGLAGLAQAPMGAFGRPPAMPTPGPPQGMPPAMRSGGIVAFADGGETDEDVPDAGPYMADPGIVALLNEPVAPPPYAAVRQRDLSAIPRTPEDWDAMFKNRDRSLKQVNEMLRSIDANDHLTPMAKKLAELQAQVMKQGPSLGGSLMALGLGMAASRNPTFAGAIGEGGLGALSRYDQQKQQQQALAMQIMAEQADTARAQQQREEQRLRNVLGAWEKEGSESNLRAQEVGSNIRELARIQANLDAKNAELTQKHQDALAKLNLPQTPDSVNNAAMIAADPNETPQRRKWAQDVIATHMKLSAAKKGPDPNAPPGLAPAPIMPAGYVRFNGMIFPSQAAADAYKKEKGL